MPTSEGNKNKSTPSKKKEEASSSRKQGGCGSGCWKYARHCFCRFGWYPLLVAPILTAAAALSIYSSTGCEFVNVDLGFTPEPNAAWNATTARLGLWYRYMPNGPEVLTENIYDADFLDTVHEDKCQWYTAAFEDEFIDNDRTWKVARIMAMVAACGASASAILAWMFLGPFFCPVNVLWPGLLLPMVMISFIAEGSKFLIFDMGICRNDLFMEVGNTDGEPLRSAESCGFGDSAIFGAVSGGLMLVSLLLVCLNVPDRRELDPHYGSADGDITGPSSEEEEEDFAPPAARKIQNAEKNQPPEQARPEQHPEDIERPSVSQDAEDSEEGSEEIYEDEINRYGLPPFSSKAAASYGGRPADPSVASQSKQDPAARSVASSMDSTLVTTLSTKQQQQQHSRNYSIDMLLDQHHQPQQRGDDEMAGITINSSVLGSSIAGIDGGDEIRISESRLSTLASVEEKADVSTTSSVASSMLEDLVQDLDRSYSYQYDEEDQTGGAGGTSSLLQLGDDHDHIHDDDEDEENVAAALTRHHLNNHHHLNHHYHP